MYVIIKINSVSMVFVKLLVDNACIKKMEFVQVYATQVKYVKIMFAKHVVHAKI